MKTVRVHPPEAYQRLRGLFDALTELEPVRFESAAEAAGAAGEALVLVGRPLKEIEAAVSAGQRVFAYLSADTATGSIPDAPLRFTRAEALDPILRGREMQGTNAANASSMVPAGAEILAQKGNDIVWCQLRRGTGRADLCYYNPPDFVEGKHLFEYLRRGNFMQLLPLLHFLRDVAGTDRFERPPLRANFMFDDPNLHCSSFGYLGYRDLVASARKHRYHVSFATIPLDQWYIHQPTAVFFREHKDHLSLLIHGNNHTRYELAQPLDEEQSLQLAAQALNRISRFEQRSGVEVSRVMAAPHAACDSTMADAMMRLGYEAACISRGSLMHYNPKLKWPMSVGLKPAEILGVGLPVLPRFGLTQDCRTELVIAGFLGQALVLVGHHEDVRGGYGLLEELADFINGLGDVQWTDMSAIARSCCQQRIAGDTLSVRAYSRKLQVNVPASVRRLTIEHAWKAIDGDAETVEVEQSGQITPYPVDGGKVSMTIKTPGVVNLNFQRARRADSRKVPAPRGSVWPIVRRVLSEGRDRLRPLLAR